MMRRGVGTTPRLQLSAATYNQHGALLRVGSRSGWPILEGARTLCLRGQVRPSVAVAKRSSWTLGFWQGWCQRPWSRRRVCSVRSSCRCRSGSLPSGRGRSRGAQLAGRVGGALVARPSLARGVGDESQRRLVPGLSGIEFRPLAVQLAVQQSGSGSGGPLRQAAGDLSVGGGVGDVDGIDEQCALAVAQGPPGWTPVGAVPGTQIGHERSEGPDRRLPGAGPIIVGLRRNLRSASSVSYTHLTLPTKRIV